MKMLKYFCKILFLFATLNSLIGPIVVASAFANGRMYASRPFQAAMATGCGRGMGPQYQTLDSTIGWLVKNGDVQYVDFNPFTLCQKAAEICLSQPSGQHCCLNACRQTFSGLEGKTVDFAKELFLNCADRCPLFPTVQEAQRNMEKSSTTFFTRK